MATEVKTPETDETDAEVKSGPVFGAWANVPESKLRQRDASYKIPKSGTPYTFSEVDVQENVTITGKELSKLFSFSERDNAQAILNYENDKRKAAARMEQSPNNPLVLVARDSGMSIDELRSLIEAAKASRK